MQSRAFRSLVEAWVALERFSPRKLTSALRFWRVGRSIGSVSSWVWSDGSSGRVSGGGGSPGPSSSGGFASTFGWKPFINAQALTRVPSTEKWSSDNSGATSRCAKIAAITLRDISDVSSRSQFLGTPSAPIPDHQCPPPRTSEQQVILHLLHQLPLGLYREQELEQAGSDQSFRRDRRATEVSVERLEIRIEAGASFTT